MGTNKYNSFFANVLLADFEIVELHKKLKILIADNKMETKQTAVDYLIQEIIPSSVLPIKYINEIIAKAKAMEKEHIIDAYEYGYWRGNNDDDFEPEEYYKNPYCNPNNETYNKQ